MRFGLVARGAVALGLALGCGGVSVDHEGGGGKGGSGTATGGSGGTGGSTAGDSTAGGAGGFGGGTSTTGGTGSVTGGTGTKGGTGGVIAVSGGTGNVGGSTGGTAMGGTGGTPDPEVCKLPLVSGPCEAAILAYGFDAKKGYCDIFYYGGCEGNANRFDSMVACADTCGMGPLAECPIAAPVDGAACSASRDTCTYAGLGDNCLCQVIEGGMCVPVVNVCRSLKQDLPPGAGGACDGPDCRSEIVLPPNLICACDGTWACKTFY